MAQPENGPPFQEEPTKELMAQSKASELCPMKMLWPTPTTAISKVLRAIRFSVAYLLLFYTTQESLNPANNMISPTPTTMSKLLSALLLALSSIPINLGRSTRVRKPAADRVWPNFQSRICLILISCRPNLISSTICV